MTVVTALALGGLLLAGCAHQGSYHPRSEEMTLKTWSSPRDRDDYPERKDENFSYLLSRKSLGIAFSGGGVRAASASWGQLRGLRHLGWLDEAQYISAVSGGAWTAVPFAFLPDDFCGGGEGCKCEAQEDECQGDLRCEADRRFLQSYVEPGELDAREDIERFPEDSYGWSLSETKLFGRFLSRVMIRFDETYSRALGARFLDRIGHYDCVAAGCCDPPPKHRYFVANEDQVERILHRGSELKPEDFTTTAEGRPFLIAGSSLLAKKRFASKKWHFFPLEITPLYSGVPQELTTVKGTAIGNGYIESPGYDAQSYRYESCDETGICKGPVTVDRPVRLRVGVRHRYRFTLSDALGSSGAAPVRFIRSIGWNLLGFPEFRYSPVGAPTENAKEYAHGDGGHIDNLGLIPLLARRTENILVFVNSGKVFGKKRGQLEKVFLPRWLADPNGASAKRTGKSGFRPLLQESGLARIQAAYEELATGLPLTYCGSFKTLENQRFGIREYSPNICWVFLSRSERWAEKLPATHKLFRKLKNPNPKPFTLFYRFPHYATFLHRLLKLRIIDLGEEQINAMAHLTSWSVVESADAISRCFGLPTEGAPSPDAERISQVMQGVWLKLGGECREESRDADQSGDGGAGPA